MANGPGSARGVRALENQPEYPHYDAPFAAIDARAAVLRSPASGSLGEAARTTARAARARGQRVHEPSTVSRFWFLEPARQKGVKAPPRQVVDAEALSRALSTRLGGTPISAESEEWSKGATVRIVTAEPASVLATMAAVAEEMGTQLHPWVADIDAMGHLLRRLTADVSE